MQCILVLQLFVSDAYSEAPSPTDLNLLLKSLMVNILCAYSYIWKLSNQCSAYLLTTQMNFSFSTPFSLQQFSTMGVSDKTFLLYIYLTLLYIIQSFRTISKWGESWKVTTWQKNFKLKGTLIRVILYLSLWKARSRATGDLI